VRCHALRRTNALQIPDRVAQSKSMNPKNFFGELKRRNVYKVAVAYC
jgi:hypothetical protein